MPDLFISYTRTDLNWAEWIAWTLDEAGFTTVLQKWDFPAGSNFVLEMQRAAAGSDRTIAILSSDYLESGFSAPEWAAAFAADPRGITRKLVPVRVRDCNPDGLLGPIVYIDLVGHHEAGAREALLTGLRSGRAKPTAKPAFPVHAGTVAKPFPGRSAAPTDSPRPALRVRRHPSDLDKHRFLREGFAEIAANFQTYLTALERENTGVATEFDSVSSSAFGAEVFVDGELRANCRVWIGGLLGNLSISYAEGSTANMTNATNESISIADGDDLALVAMLNMGVGRIPGHIDTHRMSPDDASQYLWARFLWRLT